MSAVEKIRKFYSQFSGGDHVLIVINADPDAISSAMAVRRLLWRKVSTVTISNINIIKRPDNIAMIRLLGADMVFIKEIDVYRFDRYAIVDSQPDHHECFAMFRPDVIIDHHPLSCDVAGFSDIRPKYGATATILTEYIKAAKIKPSVKLATALFHGIKTDTNNFERQTVIEDIRAFQYLYKHTNIHLAQKIEHAEIRPDFLQYFSKALQEKVIRKGRAFVHLDDVINPDVCVLVADFFMRVSSVKWSIVSGICNNKLIIIFRNDGMHKNAGKMAKKAFGDMGNAGGHKSMARAEIMVDELKKCLTHLKYKEVLKWIVSRIENEARKK